MPKLKPVVTVDQEWDRDTGRFLCAAWYTKGKLTGTNSLSTFCKAMADLPPDVAIRGHNVASADVRKWVEWGIPLPEHFTVEDSLIAARFLHPLYPEKKLDFLAKLEGYVYGDVHGEGNVETNLSGCGKSAYTTHKLYELYKAQAAKRGQLNHLTVYNKIAQAFSALEVAGLKVDVTKLGAASDAANNRLMELVPLLPDPHVITNDGILRSWLATLYSPEQLELLPRSHKSGEAQIGKEYLKLLKPPMPELEPIIEAREIHRAKTVFIDNVLEKVSEYGFIFPSYKLLVAKTQRRSSTPNIQNWPDEYRRNVISRFKDGKIVTLDFASLEARCFAWQAQCDDFLHAMMAGGYVAVASQCLGITIKDKKDPRYKQVKSTVLAVTYNMSPGLFAFREFVASGGTVRMSVSDAQKQYDMLFDRYPEIHAEMERRKAHAWSTGHTMSSVGVPLQVPLLPDDLMPANDPQWVKHYRKKVENWAINWPTQQLASYITGCALWDVQDRLAQEHGGWGRYMELLYENTQRKRAIHKMITPINEVHDALGCDVPADMVGEALEMVDSAMCEGVTLQTICPQFNVSILGTESKVGPSWDEGD
jgi:DNA polymerase I-like protein with 3'-5' exonuclease and polymerase domains